MRGASRFQQRFNGLQVTVFVQLEAWLILKLDYGGYTSLPMNSWSLNDRSCGREANSAAKTPDALQSFFWHCSSMQILKFFNFTSLSASLLQAPVELGWLEDVEFNDNQAFSLECAVGLWHSGNMTRICPELQWHKMEAGITSQKVMCNMIYALQ